MGRAGSSCPPEAAAPGGSRTDGLIPPGRGSTAPSTAPVQGGRPGGALPSRWLALVLPGPCPAPALPGICTARPLRYPAGAIIQPRSSSVGHATGREGGQAPPLDHHPWGATALHVGQEHAGSRRLRRAPLDLGSRDPPGHEERQPALLEEDRLPEPRVIRRAGVPRPPSARRDHGVKTISMASDRLKAAPPAAGSRYQHWKLHVPRPAISAP